RYCRAGVIGRRCSLSVVYRSITPRSGGRFNATVLRDPFPPGGVSLARPAPVPFWVQRGKPPFVERVDHIPHVVIRRREQLRDLIDRTTLQRCEHNPGPPQPHMIL